jgi:hypothetical protein
LRREIHIVGVHRNIVVGDQQPATQFKEWFYFAIAREIPDQDGRFDLDAVCVHRWL